MSTEDPRVIEAEQFLRQRMDANSDPLETDEDGEFKALSALTQFGLGAINEALLGFPQWLLDKDQKGLFKPEDTKGERFFRGLGSFIGFLGMPASAFKAGGKIGAKVIEKGVSKAARKAALKKGLKMGTTEAIEAIARKKALPMAAASGAGGFAAYELLRAPDKGESYEDKIASVPLNTALGGALGVTGQMLAPVFKKNSGKLFEHFKKKMPLLEQGTDQYVFDFKDKSLMQSLASDAAKVVRQADKQFSTYLKDNEFKMAHDFLNKAYTGTKKNIQKAKFDLQHTSAILKDPISREKYLYGDIEERAAMGLKGIGKVSGDMVYGLNRAKDGMLRNKWTTSARVYLDKQGESGKVFAQTTDWVRNMTDKLAGYATAEYGIASSKFWEKKAIFKKRMNDRLLKFSNVVSGEILPGDMKEMYSSWFKERKKIARAAKKLQIQVFRDVNSANSVKNLLEKRPEFEQKITEELLKAKKQYGKLSSEQYLKIAKDRVLKDTQNMSKQFVEREDYFPHFIVKPGADSKQVQQMIKFHSKRLGLKEEDFKGYWNEWVKYQKTKNASDAQKFLRFFQKTNNIKDIDTAQKLLNGFIEKEKLAKFGSLEFERKFDIPFWDPHPDRVIPRYYASAWNRLAEIKAWGQNNERMNMIINNMKKEGKDYVYAQELQARLTGADAARQLNKLGLTPDQSQAVKTFQVITKLGLAVIPNATQSINTAIVTGTRNTAKQIAKIASKGTQKEMYDFAMRTGATLESTLNDFYTGTGISGSLSQSMLKHTGFIQVERFNRVIAANAGRDYALNLAKKLSADPNNKIALRGLKEIGINIEDLAKRKYLLNHKEMIKAAQTIVNKTQFRSGPMDLPLFFSSQEGKILMQFKTFAFNQAKLFKDVFKNEVFKGNLKPLIRMVVLMPILGEGVKDVRALLTGQVRDEKGMNRLIENAAAVGSAGMITDMFQAVKYNNMVGYMTGPTVSDVGKAATGIIRTVKGKPKTLEAQILRNIPVAGPIIKNTLLPSRNLKAKRKKRLKAKLKAKELE